MADVQLAISLTTLRSLQMKRVRSRLQDEINTAEVRVADMNEGVEDSIVVCEYCNKKIKSKDKDEHLYAEHGIAI